MMITYRYCILLFKYRLEYIASKVFRKNELNGDAKQMYRFLAIENP